MFIRTIVLVAALVTGAAAHGNKMVTTTSCEPQQAWNLQSNPRSDPTGIANYAYPDSDATYWLTDLNQPLGTVALLHGRFPNSRYMAIEVYDPDGNLQDSITDTSINPDPGQNNPFRNGTAQGTYTVRLAFGKQPAQPVTNTLYTKGLQQVTVIYRVYYSDNPDELTGVASAPILPIVSIAGKQLSSCAPSPVISPETATVWGRLGLSD